MEKGILWKVIVGEEKGFVDNYIVIVSYLYMLLSIFKLWMCGIFFCNVNRF